jgi:hypothetical protein
MEQEIAATGFVHNGRMTVDGDYMLTITFPQGQDASIVRQNFDSGSRVAIAMLGQTAKPKKEPHDNDKALVIGAAMLCQNEAFQEYMGCTSEEQTIAKLRIEIGVESRADLATDKEAQVKFKALCKRFTERLTK